MLQTSYQCLQVNIVAHLNIHYILNVALVIYLFTVQLILVVVLKICICIFNYICYSEEYDDNKYFMLNLNQFWF